MIFFSCGLYLCYHIISVKCWTFVKHTTVVNRRHKIFVECNFIYENRSLTILFYDYFTIRIIIISQMFLLHLSFCYKINIFTCILDSERLPRYLIERRGKKTDIYWPGLDMEMRVKEREQRWREMEDKMCGIYERERNDSAAVRKMRKYQGM